MSARPKKRVDSVCLLRFVPTRRGSGEREVCEQEGKPTNVVAACGWVVAHSSLADKCSGGVVVA